MKDLLSTGTRRVVRTGGVLTSAAAVVLGGAALAGAAPAQAAQARAAKTGYTHSTTLKTNCAIYHNYPKSGVPARTWQKSRTASGKRTHVGVRYTYHRYALVLDYARKADPQWGFIAKSCLTDPRAYSKGAQGGTPLPDLRAPGGHMVLKNVPINPPHPGKTKRKRIGVGTLGTLRSGAYSFVIGNVSRGDSFYITTEHCGHHGKTAWILGYAPNSGRWGYVQAKHLPACL
ncbi:hypothetical protein [Actinomadura roseirufa]|uniref:hypothetical protein n=1 Tax=Actinomadura roseirufa TaxID=2094049 RepID=UPI0010417705|nr:hypothetical protein [Actinomadura roseirufa]